MEISQGLSRRNFLKTSAVAGLASLIGQESEAHPPGDFGVIPRPHFDFHMTPFGTFTHMRWGPFNVYKPVYPDPTVVNREDTVNFHRIQSYTNRGNFEYVNPCTKPQGIICEEWIDKNKDDNGCLSEYSRLNQQTYDSDKEISVGIHLPRDFFVGSDYDIRVFGPRWNLAGRVQGTVDGKKNPWTFLDLSKLSRDPNNGPGIYYVEYIIDDKIKEKRSFTLADVDKPRIPNLKTPEEMGIEVDSDGLGIFSAAKWEDSSNGNNKPEYYEFSGINLVVFSTQDTINLVLYNGINFEGEAKLIIYNGDGTKVLHSGKTPLMIDHQTAGRPIQPGNITPADYMFTYQIKGKSDLFGIERNDLFKPQKFSVR